MAFRSWGLPETVLPLVGRHLSMESFEVKPGGRVDEVGVGGGG